MPTSKKTRGTSSKKQKTEKAAGSESEASDAPASAGAGYRPPVSRGQRLLPIFFLIGLGLARLLYYWFSPGSTGDGVWAETAPGAAYKVVKIPGKGKGAIAIRDIQQGEQILNEKPLFLVPPTIQSSPVEFLKEKLSHLNSTQLAGFWGLSYVNFPADKNPETDIDELAVAIFETNAVRAGPSVGIFPRMARLNHGCSSAFNSVYSFREGEGTLYIHAIKPIKKGEELLTTYTDTKKPRDQRRAYLETNYGFKCTCSVCTLPEAERKASDARLTRMQENGARFAKWIDKTIDGVEALNLVRAIWKDGEEEGYWSERGRLAADALWVAAGHSDVDAMVEWGELANKWYDIELGVGSEHAKFTQEMMRMPLKHPAWASREEMKVGGPEGTR